MTTPDNAPARVTVEIKRRRREDPVHFIVRLANEHDEPVDLYLRGRDITFDVIVARAKGPIVWQRLQGQVIQAILRLETLGPLEAIELEGEWNLRDNKGRHVGYGSYEMKAVVLTDDTMSLESPPVLLDVDER